MSKVDKMLEIVGFTKKKEDETKIYYMNNDIELISTIEFDKKNKKVSVVTADGLDDEIFSFDIDMKLLKAINEKCKEMGWLNE